MSKIYIKVTIKGEPDVPPFTRLFQYVGGADELMLQHSVGMIVEKLEKDMKLNVNEALLVYAHYVASEMRAGKSSGVIEKSAQSALSADQVLLGVPETLRIIEFDAIVGDRGEQVVLREPLPSSGYVMAAE